MWGDYHALELGVYLLRLIEDKPYLTFWSESRMTIADLAQIAGRTYPARRQDAKPRRRGQSDSGYKLLDGPCHARAEWRTSALA